MIVIPKTPPKIFALTSDIDPAKVDFYLQLGFSDVCKSVAHKANVANKIIFVTRQLNNGSSGRVNAHSVWIVNPQKQCLKIFLIFRVTIKDKFQNQRRYRKAKAKWKFLCP